MQEFSRASKALLDREHWQTSYHHQWSVALQAALHPPTLQVSDKPEGLNTPVCSALLLLQAAELFGQCGLPHFPDAASPFEVVRLQMLVPRSHPCRFVGGTCLSDQVIR